MRSSFAKVLLAGNELTSGLLWGYRLLEKKHEILVETNFSNVVQRCQKDNPDLVVLDISRPDLQTLTVMKELREVTTGPLLILTSLQDPESILKIYKTGADDCIIKPCELSVFYAKVNAWLRQCLLMPVDMLEPLRVGRVYLIPLDRVVIVDRDGQIRLTNKEMRLLYALMSWAGRTVPTEELIRQVWGYEDEVGGTVLKNTIYRLRQKLEDKPARLQCIVTIPGCGYKFNISP